MTVFAAGSEVGRGLGHFQSVGCTWLDILLLGVVGKHFNSIPLKDYEIMSIYIYKNANQIQHDQNDAVFP